MSGKFRQNEADKKAQKEKERRELIRGVLFGFLWFSVDLWFVWPQSHVWAIAWGASGFAIHLLTSSWTIKNKLIYLVLLLLCTAFIIYIVPPNETEIHGFLVPGNDPAPSGPCEKANALQNSEYSVHFGGNEAILTFGKTAVLILKDNLPILLFKVDQRGLALSGQIFSRHGENALLVDNEFWLNQNTTFHSERPDRSTLIVRDNSGTEVLAVKYQNRHSVSITGDFFFEGVARIVLTKTETIVRTPKVKAAYKDNCLANGAGLIKVFQDGTVSTWNTPQEKSGFSYSKPN